MWVATLRSICKPWSLLWFWNSNCCYIGFLDSVRRKRVVDWNTDWFLLSNSDVISHNNKYKLGRTGLPSLPSLVAQHLTQSQNTMFTMLCILK